MPDPVLVIVPTRDRPALLAEALGSLVAQTDGDWTAVVADDGEIPTARPVVNALGASPDLRGRIAVVETAARSPGGARNDAFRHARERLGPRPDVVAFLDDDDLWLPRHLEVVRAALAHDPGAAFVHTGALTRTGDSVASYHDRAPPPRTGPAFRALLARNFVATSSVAMAAERLASEGGFRADLSHGEEWDLWLRCAWKAPVHFVPEPTVTYRSHAGNTSRSLATKALAHVRALEGWWERRDALDPADRRVLARSLARRHRSHVRRLLREGAPRSVALAAAREHGRTLPRLRTWLAAYLG